MEARIPFYISNAPPLSFSLPPLVFHPGVVFKSYRLPLPLSFFCRGIYLPNLACLFHLNIFRYLDVILSDVITIFLECLWFFHSFVLYIFLNVSSRQFLKADGFAFSYLIYFCIFFVII